MQFEQLRGEMVTRVTSRAVEMLAYIAKLMEVESNERLDAVKVLLEVVKGLADFRRRLRDLPTLPPLLGSYVLPELQMVRNDLEDAEPIFDELGKSVAEQNLIKINEAAKGLLERIYGSGTRRT